MAAATPTAPVTAPVTALAARPAAPTLTVELLARMDRKTLGDLFKARFGFDMPKGWNWDVAAKAYMGTAFPAGTNGKACAQWHYTAKAGVAPAKSWTVAKLTAEVAKDAPTLPRGKSAKESAVAAYILATGYLPAKSWTVADIVAKTATKTPPARNAVKAAA